MTHALRMIAIAATVTAGLAASPAFAADNAMKVCGAKYQAARTAKSIPATETWNQYLAQCRGTMAKPVAVATPAKPAPAVAAAKPARVVTAAKPATAPGQPTAAQTAMYARERQCGTQWKADKAAKKVPASETWPQYWSACNKRMK